jgi:Ca-activated chloride channel family protein
VGDEEGTQIAKVLLVITDGEDHEPGAIKLAQDQASKGMRIITFGVGTRKGGPIPLRDERGNLSGYLKDKSGQTIITAANEEALQELARAGHGGFYFASSGGSEVDEIKKEIDRMEKTEFDSDFATVYNDRYQVFLLLSLGLALIEALIRERRKTGRIWKGRFEVDKS